MLEFLEKGYYSDHTLVFNNVEIKIHLEFLSEKSEYFKSIFKKNFKEKEKTIINNFYDFEGKEIEKDLFKLFLKNLYEKNSVFPFSLKEMINYLKLCDYFKTETKEILRRLKDKIEHLHTNFIISYVYLIKDYIFYNGFCYKISQDYAFDNCIKKYEYLYISCNVNVNIRIKNFVLKDYKWIYENDLTINFKDVEEMRIIKKFPENISLLEYNFLSFFIKDVDFSQLIKFSFEDFDKISDELKEIFCKQYLNFNNKSDLQKFYDYCLTINNNINISKIPI